MPKRNEPKPKPPAIGKTSAPDDQRVRAARLAMFGVMLKEALEG